MASIQQHPRLLSRFLLTSLILMTILSAHALRPFSLDGDYIPGGQGYRRYSIFRRQSKGDTGFRTDLGKRFSDAKYLRDDDFAYDDISELNEQKRRMFRNDLGKK